MELIDRKALIKKLNDYEIPFDADINEIICNMPTVDAAEVVRCKDCEFFESSNDGFGRCAAFGGIVNGNNDFCSSAIKEEQ